MRICTYSNLVQLIVILLMQKVLFSFFFFFLFKWNGIRSVKINYSGIRFRYCESTDLKKHITELMISARKLVCNKSINIQFKTSVGNLLQAADQKK